MQGPTATAFTQTCLAFVRRLPRRIPDQHGSELAGIAHGGMKRAARAPRCWGGRRFLVRLAFWHIWEHDTSGIGLLQNGRRLEDERDELPDSALLCISSISMMR